MNSRASGAVTMLIGIGIIGWMIYGGKARTLAMRIA